MSFSGGKDSTAMLLRMVEEKMPIDEIIFIDTGLEFPEIYRHIDKVRGYINMPITILKPEHSFEYYMFDDIKVKGDSKGESGRKWPSSKIRWCNTKLKLTPKRKYLK